MTMPLPEKPVSLKTAMMSTPELSSLIAIVQRTTKTINLESILKEAGFLHSQRPARTLHSKTLTISLLIAASGEEIRVRSRLVELLTSAQRQRDMLHLATKQTAEFMQHRFRTRLAEGFSTEAARKRAVTVIMQPAYDLEGELDDAISTLNAFTVDIDKTGYTLRNLVDLLKMQLGTRAIVE
jgi:hypothetical protein